jgi:threonine synthase
VWVKDETGNVSGAHKGRHFIGIELWLAVVEALGRAPAAAASAPLAVASCGNAALAAAVVAKAAGRRLRVFIPPDAEPAVVARLRDINAELEVCPRRSGERGDPCFNRFQEATAGGDLPFTCQGSENGLAIEGGETLAWEVVSVLLRDGLELDHLVVQVGGGALASACVQAFQEARALGMVSRLPRIHTVQTASAHPLQRAYERLTERIALRMERESGRRPATGGSAFAMANWIRRDVPDPTLRAELHAAATRRSAFMRPWESEPRSIARGILDDETYDWLAVVEGMLETGGVPLVVSESMLAEAHALAVDATGIPVDPTGSAGLAGCLELARRSAFAADESVAVVFTGGRRAPA